MQRERIVGEALPTSFFSYSSVGRCLHGPRGVRDALQSHMAERELSVFIRAVTELFDPEQGKLSRTGLTSQS